MCDVCGRVFVCSVSEVAFIGSSLLEGCSGHNLAEAAVAGCAVLVGEHAGHFSTMADELNQAAVSCGVASRLHVHLETLVVHTADNALESG
jgi:3-deoxy-D-manno-octulosonic-acid transferase